MPLDDLWRLGEQVGGRLRERGETIAVAESSAGGLISAALLGIPESALADIRPSTEAYAQLLAKAARERVSATWGLGETGASGPTGNRYGDPAGHACLAVAGPAEHALTVETAQTDRLYNMQAFASAALQLLAGYL